MRGPLRHQEGLRLPRTVANVALMAGHHKAARKRPISRPIAPLEGTKRNCMGCGALRIEVTDSLSDRRRAEWRAFIARATHSHPEQDPAFAEGWRALGQDVIFAAGRVGPELRAVGMFTAVRHQLLPGHHWVARALSGPVCDDPQDMTNFLHGVARAPAFARVGALQITPYWMDDDLPPLSEELARAGWRQFEPDFFRKSGLSDITGTPDEIVARFSATARRKLRKILQVGLTVEHVTDEAVAMEAFEVLNRHHDDREGGRIDEALFRANFRSVYSTNDLGTLMLVRHKGRILAGAMRHRDSRTVHFLRFFIDDEVAAELGKLRVAPLIAIESMKWANARGCSRADWGGYEKGLDPSHPYHSIYRYKEEFHPVEVQRLPGHQKILKPMLYHTGTLRDRVKGRLRPVVRSLRAKAG